MRPQAWQRSLGLTKIRDDRIWEMSDAGASGRWKNRLKSRAQELFPDIKVTLRTSDALLLAHYCKEKYQ